MQERNCDAMVVNNPVDEYTGFGKERVFASILLKDDATKPAQLVEMDKDALAEALLAKLDLLLGKIT
jgi:nucleotidyltransferase/DNA polymerase involved in DNA repair